MGYSREVVHAYASTIPELGNRTEFLEYAQQIPYFERGGRMWCQALEYRDAFRGASSVVRGVAEGLADRVQEMLHLVEGRKAFFDRQVKVLKGRRHVVIVNFERQQIGVVRKKVAQLLFLGVPELFLSGDASQEAWEILDEHLDHSFRQQVVEQALSSREVGMKGPFLDVDVVGGYADQVHGMMDSEKEMVFVPFEEALVALLVYGKQIEATLVLQLMDLFRAYFEARPKDYDEEGNPLKE